MSGALPERIRNREGKTRFTAFLDFAVWERGAGEIQELLRAPHSAALGFLDGGRLRDAYRKFVNGGTEESRHALWYAITLEIWLRRCELMRAGRRDLPARRSAA